MCSTCLAKPGEQHQSWCHRRGTMPPPRPKLTSWQQGATLVMYGTQGILQ